MLFRLILIPLFAAALQAAPARHPSYEPVPAPAAASRPNLFLNAKVTASGHWDAQTPDRAVNGKREPADHWACEKVPVWHQVDLAEATELSAVKVWPYWGDGRVYQYKVEGSADGRTWKMLGDMTANSITSSSEGNLFSFEPVRVKHVRTTFLGNSSGAAAGGHLVEIEGYAQTPEVALAGGIGTTDTRYPPAGAVGGLRPPREGIALHAWRGERVNAQVLVHSDAAHEALRFDPLQLTGGSHALNVMARFVRHTLADGKPQGDILDDTAAPAVDEIEVTVTGGSTAKVFARLKADQQ